MTPPRLVFDTNVLLSALLFHQGSVAWLRQAWQSDTVRPLASRDTTEELIRVLTYPKFKLTDMDREELLGDYLPWCETVNVSANTKVPDCRDPSDRPFLALAIAAEADALITGDKDLLELTDDFKVPILTPAAFKKYFDDNTMPGLNQKKPE
ncbi:putative toxin-antitoxin system toxin component, PIN family [Magnetospira thiophila]